MDICGYGGRLNVLEANYPGRLNNCEGCHLEGTYYPVDPAKVFGTTVDANDPMILTDDKVLSPNVAVCSSCHASDLERQHMVQNGGDFDAFTGATITPRAVVLAVKDTLIYFSDNKFKLFNHEANCEDNQ